MASPLVSIIIPAYKAEKYLRCCLDSVIKQTLKEIEIICIDDGSPDDCPNILQEYAAVDPRVIIVRKEPGCLSSARNAGIQRATAPYITFVDADDWLNPELYEVAATIMQADPTLDFVYWGYFRYIEELDSIDNDETLNPKFPYIGRCLVTDGIRLAACVTAWSKLYKTEIIKQHQITFPEGLHFEDDAFWWMFNIHVKYGFFLDEPYYYYRIRTDSLMGLLQSKKLESNFDYLLISQLILDYYRQKGFFDEKNKLLRLVFINLALAGYKIAVEPEKYRSIALEMIEQNGWHHCDFKDLIKIINRPPGYKRPKYTLLEKLFSAKNCGDRKVIRIFGVSIRIKRKMKTH